VLFYYCNDDDDDDDDNDDDGDDYDDDDNDDDDNDDDDYDDDDNINDFEYSDDDYNHHDHYRFIIFLLQQRLSVPSSSFFPSVLIHLTLVSMLPCYVFSMGKLFGADPETFYGLAGVGDAFGTCLGPLSRNRWI
jgi:hypothetical protein